MTEKTGIHIAAKPIVPKITPSIFIPKIEVSGENNIAVSIDSKTSENSDELYKLVNNFPPIEKTITATTNGDSNVSGASIPEVSLFPMEKVIEEKKELEKKYGKYDLLRNNIPFYWYVKDNEGKTQLVEVGDRVEYINLEQSFDKAGNFIGSTFGNVIGIDNQYVMISIESGAGMFRFLMSEHSKILHITKYEKELLIIEKSNFFDKKNMLIVLCFFVILLIGSIFLIF